MGLKKGHSKWKSRSGSEVSQELALRPVQTDSQHHQEMAGGAIVLPPEQWRDACAKVQADCASENAATPAAAADPVAWHLPGDSSGKLQGDDYQRLGEYLHGLVYTVVGPALAARITGIWLDG